MRKRAAQDATARGLVSGIEHMEITEAALLFGSLHHLYDQSKNGAHTKKKGILKTLFNSFGKLENLDKRHGLIEQLGKRFNVDEAQFKSVNETADFFLDQLPTFKNEDRKNNRKLLSWASFLHEIGLAVSRTLRSGITERIDREIENSKAGKPSGIQFKLNSILDESFVSKLYEASQAGVKIELLIRGICAVQPGLKGISENITVKSVLGRFLEHSRIFHFINAGESEYWIGSADLMGRNLDRRVESLIRVDRKEHHQRLQAILDLGLSDKVSSWTLAGTEWVRKSINEQGKPLNDVHATMIKLYRNDR